MKDLNNDIKSGSFKQIYLLYGEEDYLKNLYKNRLRQAILPEDDTMNLSSYQGKGINVSELIDQAETMPFFAEHRLILVEQSGFLKNASPELTDYLPRMPKETILVFVETEVDKRSRLYKAIRKDGRIVEMNRQDEKTLQTWIMGRLKQERKNITRDALFLFMEKTGNDMGNIANELEKLICYTIEKSAIEREDVEGICTINIESRIFDMIRAVTEKQQKKALDLYYDLLALKEPPMRILFLFARQFNQMLQLRSFRDQGLDSSTAAQRAGMAPYIAKRVLAQAERFRMEQLQQAVADCVEAETAVKSGKLGDSLAVELLIVRYSGGL